MWRVPLALIGYFGLVGGLALGLPKGEQLWRDNITGDQSAYEAVVLDHPDWELVLAEHHASIDEVHVVYTHSRSEERRVGKESRYDLQCGEMNIEEREVGLAVV